MGNTKSTNAGLTMTTILNWIHVHPYLTLYIVLAYVSANLVFSMPTPNDKSSTLYKYIFTALHGIYGNIPRIAMIFFPQIGVFLGKFFNKTEDTPK